MRLVGTTAMGVRLPIIGPGDDLAQIVVDHVLSVAEADNMPITDSDIIGITEGIVAKAENNFATVADIAADVREKLGDCEIGLVFPMLSRNRFYNILKGIAAAAPEKKLHILLSYPQDEVGNPIMDLDNIDLALDRLGGKMATEAEFVEACGGVYRHNFTGVDYIELYKSAGENVQIYFSQDPRDILQLTKNVIVGEIHTRERTRKRLLGAGAEKVFTLCEILSTPVNESGCNTRYGVLGSNLSTDDSLKLFPNRAPEFVQKVQNLFRQKCGASPEVLVYGDGAFKDPVCGIWELADPVVSPGFTTRLGGQPSEIKMKFVADNAFANLSGEAKRNAITHAIKEKHQDPTMYREGTTPRQFSDLVGSLCDLMGGSGDKGTPVMLIRGYFDDFSAE